MNKEKMNEEFMREISRIKEPQVFIGVTKLFGVGLLEEEKGEDGKFKCKDFVDIFDELMAKYAAATKKRRKEVLNILKLSNKVEEGGKDGDSTEDTNKEISE